MVAQKVSSNCNQLRQSRAIMVVQATFASMGLRSEKAMATHLLLENVHESSPVPDIALVDYLAGNLDCTHLHSLPGLPMFVDNVYGYLRLEDCVVRGGHLSCTTGEDGAMKNNVARIATALSGSIGEGCGHIQMIIVHTLADRENTEGSTIRVTVAQVKFNTKKKTRMQWLELYPGTEPAGLFVAKVDVSEIPMDELQASLPAFERQLLAHSYGLYSIYYMQDFSRSLTGRRSSTFSVLSKDSASRATLPP